MKSPMLHALLLTFLCTSSFAAVIHVPGDQPTIQAGLDAAADGDTVLVADGLWQGPDNRDLNFQGKSITLQSANGPANCIIDAEGNLDYPRRCVWFSHGEGRGSVLRGFTLTGGYGGNYGGAIVVHSESPTITGNIFSDNHGNDGSAIGCVGGSPLIEKNIFYDNGYFSMSDGGALYFVMASPVIRDNLFLENINYGEAGAGYFEGGAPLIEGNRFIGNASENILREFHVGGALVLRDLGPDTVIRGNLFRENRAGEGGAIYCNNASPKISGNVFKNNTANNEGGAIRCIGSSAEITGNRFSGNTAIWGGAVSCTDDSTPVITGCLLTGNRADYAGGGVLSRQNAFLQVVGCTFVANRALYAHGGAISAFAGSSVVVRDCILWGNDAPEGPAISLGMETAAAAMTISYSDVEGGQAGTVVDPSSTLTWGAGMIDTDPCFAAAALGGFFLCQVAAGQAEDSPCVDAGDPANPARAGSTRTDLVADDGVPDMGYHFSAPGRLVTGPGPGPDNPPEVRLFIPDEGAEPVSTFDAYSVPRYGVNVTCGDLNGDGTDAIITGAGPGAVFGPHVRGFKADGTPLPWVSFLAYGTHKFGVNVACGDLDGDGGDEIVTGAGPGAVFGPHVRGFDPDGTAVPGVSFFAYGTPKWGVNVACGDFDGDGCDEIVTGAGPGAVFGPHVRGWDVDGLAARAMPGISFFAYGTDRWGVRVAAGDIDGDGLDELVTAPGPAGIFGAHVRGWDIDGTTVSPMPEVNFIAWDMSEASHGATVGSSPDLNGDGRDEILIGSGPDPDGASMVAVYRHDGSGLVHWFDVVPYEGLGYGATVAAGRLTDSSQP